MRISFKAKPETIYNVDETVAFVRIKVPAIGRRHVDMDTARCHAKFGIYANSDLFPSMLARAIKAAGVGEYIRLDRIPPSVQVDTSGFLASVTITL